MSVGSDTDRAREVLRYTARRETSHRAPGRRTDQLADLYNALLAIAVGVAMTVGLLQSLGVDATGAGRPVGDAEVPGQAWEPLGLDPGWLPLAFAGVLLVGQWCITARLGPLGAPRGERRWWLTLPVARRPLLRRHLIVPFAVSGLVGLLGAGLVILSGVAVAPAGALLVSGPALAVAVVAAQAVAQEKRTPTPDHRGARRLVLAADLTAVVLVAGVIMVAALRLRVPQVSGGTAWMVAAALVALAGALVVLADRGLARLSDTEIAASGDLAGESAGATLSLDTRALARALDRRTSSEGRARVRGSRDARPSARLLRAGTRAAARAPRWIRPHLAVFLGELVLLLRTPRHLLQPWLGLALVAVSLTVPATFGAGSSAGASAGAAWPAAAAVMAGGYVAVLALVEGARQAQLSQAVDAALPLSARGARLARALLPMVIMSVWGAVALVLVGSVRDATLAGGPAQWQDGAWWALLGALAGVGLAGAGIRGAYRPSDLGSWTLVSTPVGPVAPGVIAALLVGPDLAVLALLPTAVSVVAGTVTPLVVVLQAAASAAALAWAVIGGARTRTLKG